MRYKYKVGDRVSCYYGTKTDKGDDLYGIITEVYTKNNIKYYQIEWDYVRFDEINNSLYNEDMIILDKSYKREETLNKLGV